jgi:hypothetical protein
MAKVKTPPKEPALPKTEDVLRRMLNTPPQSDAATPKRKTTKPAK